MTMTLEGGERSASGPGRSLPLVPIVQETVWAPGPVWTGAENLAFTAIRSPDRPARSQSLYRLSYSATPSSAEVKERIELYLYSPSELLWPVLG